MTPHTTANTCKLKSKNIVSHAKIAHGSLSGKPNMNSAYNTWTQRKIELRSTLHMDGGATLCRWELVQEKLLIHKMLPPIRKAISLCLMVLELSKRRSFCKSHAIKHCLKISTKSPVISVAATHARFLTFIAQHDSHNGMHFSGCQSKDPPKNSFDRSLWDVDYVLQWSLNKSFLHTYEGRNDGPAWPYCPAYYAACNNCRFLKSLMIHHNYLVNFDICLPQTREESGSCVARVMLALKRGKVI